MKEFTFYLWEDTNMKNNLFVVYGGKWDFENNMWTDKSSIRKFKFKNKELAMKKIEDIIDGFMKSKSYSLNYTIGNKYEDDEKVLKTDIINIFNKKDEIVFSVEVVTINMNEIIL